MPVAISCPNPVCKFIANISEDRLGRSVRCKQCGQAFVAQATVDGDDRPTVDTAPAAPPAKNLPSKIGRFVIKERLGSGAFGTVYRAVDPELEREVALKVPHPATHEQPKRLERFIREAKAAARLRHPHIVPVYDAGRDGNTYFIASALITGMPLSQAIPQGGMEPSVAAQIVADLAEALAYAHAQGIVHRDVKPGNVMLDATNRPHLMDFGLASRHADGDRLTEYGTVMGTPAYMAPEQAEGQQEKPQPASDQYSLGAVLYELLTGQTPFSGPSDVLIYNAVHTSAPPPQSLRKGLPRELSAICLRALAKQIKQRYPDCQALADDLRRWLAGPTVAPNRTKVALRWAGAALVLIGVTVGAVAYLRPDRKPNEPPPVVVNPPVQGENSKDLFELAQLNLLQRRYILAADALKRIPADKRDWLHRFLTLQAEEGLENGAQVLPMSQARAFLRDSPILVTYSDEKVTLFDASTNTVLKEHVLNEAGFSAVLSANGTRLAAEVIEKKQMPGMKSPPAPQNRLSIGIWNTETGVRLKNIELTATPFHHVVIRLSPGGRWLATVIAGRLEIWNTETGTTLPNLAAELQEPSMLAISPDERRLFAVAKEKDQGVLKSWLLPEGTVDPKVNRVVGLLLDLAVSPDGKFLAMAGGGKGNVQFEKSMVTEFVEEQRAEKVQAPDKSQKDTWIERIVRVKVPVMKEEERKVVRSEFAQRIQVIDTMDNSLRTDFQAAVSVNFLTWHGLAGQLLFNGAQTQGSTELASLDLGTKQSVKILSIPGVSSGVLTSRDGRYLVSENNQKQQTLVWCARPTRLVQQWAHQPQPAEMIHVNVENKRLAAFIPETEFGDLGTVKLFDFETGKLLLSENKLFDCELDDKSKWLVVAEGYGVTALRLFDSQNGAAFSGIAGVKHLLAVNDTGTRVVGTHVDDSRIGRKARLVVPYIEPGKLIPNDRTKTAPLDVKVHDYRTGKVICTLDQLEINVHWQCAFGFTPDGLRIAQSYFSFGNEDLPIVVWDAQSGEHRFEAKGREPVFCARGPYVAFVHNDGKAAMVAVWDYLANRKLFDAKLDDPWGQSDHLNLFLSPDGAKLIAENTRLGSVRGWDVIRAKEEFTEQCAVHHQRQVLNDAMSRDGRWFAIAKGDNGIAQPGPENFKTMPKQTPFEEKKATQLRLPSSRDLMAMLVLFQQPIQPGIPAPIIQEDAHQVQASYIVIRDVKLAKVAHMLPRFRGAVTNLTFSADNQLLAVGIDAGADASGEVRVWRVATGETVATFSAFKGPVRSVALSHDGSLVAASGEDRSIKVWRVEPPANPSPQSGLRPQPMTSSTPGEHIGGTVGKTPAKEPMETKAATGQQPKKNTPAVAGREYKIDAELKAVIDAQDSKADAYKYLYDQSVPIKDRERFAKEVLDAFGPVTVPKDLKVMIEKSPQKKDINDYLNLLSVPRAERMRFMDQLRKDLAGAAKEEKKEKKKEEKN